MADAAEKIVVTSGLTQLVRDAFELHDSNVAKTVEMVVFKLTTDKKLLRSIVEAETQSLVSLRVGRTMRSDNNSIVRAASRDTVVALADGLVRSFLDWRLPDGTKLRDANRPKVIAKADEYKKLADGNLHRASWLRLVAQHMPDGKTVGDVMNEERLRELFKEAQNAR